MARESRNAESALLLQDLDDVFRTDEDQRVLTAFAEEDHRLVIARDAKIPRLLAVLRAIAQPHGKRPKRLPLSEAFDFLDLHRPEITHAGWSAKRKKSRQSGSGRSNPLGRREVPLISSNWYKSA